MIKKLFLLILCFAISKSFAQVTTDTLTVDTNNDSYVRSNYPTTNYNTDVWTFAYYVGGQTYRSYLQWDLSSIPTNAIVVEAKILLNGAWINNAASHPAYLQRVSSSWSGATITWNNQPGTITSDQVSVTHAQTSSTGWQNFDVTSHVQDMVNYPDLNFGWCFKLQSESGSGRGMQYYSSSHSYGDSTAAKLVIIYINPIEINGFVKHCTNGNEDGEITVTVSEGVGTYAGYDWLKFDNGDTYSIETGTNMANIDLENVGPGLYLLEVEDDSGYTNYKYFMVGEEGNTTSVHMYANDDDTASLYWEDAFSSNTSTANQDVNYGDFEFILPSYDYPNSWRLKNFSKLKMDFDNLMIIDTARLELTCVYTSGTSSHYRAGTNTNKTYVDLVTSDWEEGTLTYNTEPTSSNLVRDSIPQTNPSGFVLRNDSINLLPFVEYWQDYPDSNYGFKMELAEYPSSSWARLVYASSDYTTVASKRPKLKFSYRVETIGLDASFDDTLLLGDISVNAPNGELPYSYFISLDSILPLDTLWAWHGDTLGLDSTTFYHGKINSQSYSFNDLQSGRYNVGVFDNTGELILDKWIYLGPELSLIDSTNILISGDTISINSSLADAGSCIYTYPIYSNKTGGFDIEITQLDDDVVVGFNNLHEPPVIYTTDFEYGIEIKSNGTANLIMNDSIVRSVSCSIGDVLSLIKYGDKIEFKKNYEMEFLIEEIDLPIEGFKNEVLFKGPLGNIILMPVFINPPQVNKYLLQPYCGEPAGSLELLSTTFFVFAATNVELLEDGNSTAIYNGSLPMSTTTLSPGLYTLNVTWNNNLFTSEQLIVGYPINWIDIQNSEVLSGTVNTLDRQVDNSTTGIARSLNQFNDDGTEHWIQTKQFKIGSGSSKSLFKITDGNTDYLIIWMNSMGTTRYLSFWGQSGGINPESSLPSPTYDYVTNVLLGWPTVLIINDQLPFKIKVDWDNSIKVYHGLANNLILDYSPTFGTENIYLKGFLQGDAVLENTLATFCHPIASNFVKLRRVPDGGYYHAVDRLLKVEYDEEYNDRELKFKVYDDTYDPLNPSKSHIDMPMASISYGDNRLEFDFNYDCPGANCLATGNYMLEIINGKDEKLYLRFKL